MDSPSQELVILNTDKGFVPETIRVRKDARYVVHVVNVNTKEKNVSFMLNSFSEYHGTYFGKLTTFTITPKKEGVFSFQCPETSSEGRMVVYTQPGTFPSNPEVKLRSPAADEDFYGRQ